MILSNDVKKKSIRYVPTWTSQIFAFGDLLHTGNSHRLSVPNISINLYSFQDDMTRYVVVNDKNHGQ